MIKKFIFSIALCGLSFMANAQESNDILAIVSGKMIPVADFESTYFKNHIKGGETKGSIEGFLNDFLDSRVQVAEAKTLGLDTLHDFRRQMENLSFIVSNRGQIEKEEDYAKQIAKPQVQIAHLILALDQHASSAEQQLLRNRMDSIYRVIQNGADFMQTANLLTQGEVKIEWLGRNQTLEDVETAAFHLSEGELSVPLLSVDGFHLIKCLKVASPANSIQHVDSQPSMNSSLLNDYGNGMLMQYVYEKVMRDKAQNDAMGLQQFFFENQKKYIWEIPHFKGVVFQCKDKRTKKTVAKLLAKHPMERWQSIIEDSTYLHVFGNVKASPIQLFSLGENPLVDELVFGGPKTQRDTDYPIYGVLGKKQKNHPDNATDIEEIVVADYQEYLERKWLDGLRERHGVVINDKALKRQFR